MFQNYMNYMIAYLKLCAFLLFPLSCLLSPDDFILLFFITLSSDYFLSLFFITFVFKLFICVSMDMMFAII